MRPRRLTFLVSFIQPELASIRDCREYVDEAVASMKGSRRPPGAYGEDDYGDPMWELDPDTVKVSRHTKPLRIRRSPVKFK